MINIISGGVGSGKSVTAVKHAVDEAKHNKILTNFRLKKISHYRLKKNDIIKRFHDKKRKIIDSKVNWDFWEKHRNCDIFLDEVHNIINARNAMSKQNKLMSEWLSQIRKVWGASGDQNLIDKLRRVSNNAFSKIIDAAIAKSNNIWLITQRPRKLDVNFRELSHCLVQCNKVQRGKDVFILNNYWFGDDNDDAISYMEMGVKPKKRIFYANPYFKFYDSYALIGAKEGYL